MAVTVQKMKVGPDALSAEQIVGYLLDRQDAGDYYSESGHAFMRWFTNERVRTRFALGRRLRQARVAAPHRGPLSRQL